MNKKMLTKIVTALILIALVVPPLLYGGIFLRILLTLMVALASIEIASLEDGEKHYPFAIIIFIATNWMVYIEPQNVSFAMVAWLVFMFCADLVTEKMTTDRIAYTFIMTMIIVLACQGIIRIYNVGFNGLGMLFVAIACYLCDTGAWFFGSFFGKHKMNPRISPNKTWEGAIGGYIVGLIGSFLFGYFVQMRYAEVAIPLSLLITSSLVLPLIAEIGDLSFSAIKRRWGIKDYGSLLPGHGGILDRVDSMLFCLMVFNGLMLLWGIY